MCVKIMLTKTGGIKSYLRQVSLQLVPGICCLLHTLCEGNIDSIPFLPHLVGTRVQHTFDLMTHVLGGSTLALGSLDVVVTELSPGLGNRNTEGRK